MKHRLIPAALFSALLALASVPAQAVGKLADVTITDRDTGANLPVYVARGEYWVAGRPGARYAVTVRNRLRERVLAVPSVDGVNVLSGETASWDQGGYVFAPHERYQITGWRKSSSQVAAFEFSAAGDSYAGRTGRPANVGVIGVALFREKRPEPVAQASPGQYSRRESESNSNSLDRLKSLPPSPEPAAAAKKSQATIVEAEVSDQAATGSAQAKAAPMPSPKLGTAHGQRESSVVTETEFERSQSQPNEVIRIRYDSRENLIASGVIREPAPRLPLPNAFPQSDRFSYVPDPR